MNMNSQDFTKTGLADDKDIVLFDRQIPNFEEKSQYHIKDYIKLLISKMKIQHIDLIYKLRYFRKNKEYLSFARDIYKIDSIAHYEEFKDAVKKVLEIHGKATSYSAYAYEAYRYGHYNALLQYAQINKGKYPYIQAIEHGIRSVEEIWKFNPTFVVYCAQGDYRTTDIHRIDPWRMAFSVGPYIHYASKYYSEEKEKLIKKKFGKILLVIPSHNWECSSNDLPDSNFVDLIYKKYADNFDTVMVSAYWNDVNDAVYEDFAKRGAKIVSAGLRGDNQFISRLKTIISLADAVVGDSVGTHIGYCMYMKKPFYMEGMYSIKKSEYSTEERETLHDLFIKEFNSESLTSFESKEKYNSLLYELLWGKNQINTEKEIIDLYYIAFSFNGVSFTEKQILLQNEIYKKFWGGNKIWSKEDIGCLFEIIRTVLNISKGRPNTWDVAMKEYWTYLKQKNDNSSEKKLMILKKTLGNIKEGIWKNI